jgi:hypothetical protein
MAKGRGPSALYDRLSALRREGPTAEARVAVAEGLKNRSSVVVEKAAALAAEFNFSDLCNEITAAFTRFMRDPGYEDRGWGAKIALARAAVDLNCPTDELFLDGVRLSRRRGPMPVPPPDPAAELRQLCALGLVQVRHPQMMNELVELLMDRIPQGRIGAVRALGQSGRDDAALVLRLKALTGDIDSEVTAEVLSALIQISADDQLDFVAGYLSDEDEQIRAAAALAIAASRHQKGFELLRVWFERNPTAAQPTALIAMATCRIPPATDYLLWLVARSERFAPDAVAALAFYKHDPALRERARKAAEDCGIETVKSAYARHFGVDA